MTSRARRRPRRRIRPNRRRSTNRYPPGSATKLPVGPVFLFKKRIQLAAKRKAEKSRKLICWPVFQSDCFGVVGLFHFFHLQLNVWIHPTQETLLREVFPRENPHRDLAREAQDASHVLRAQVSTQGDGLKLQFSNKNRRSLRVHH